MDLPSCCFVKLLLSLALINSCLSAPDSFPHPDPNSYFSQPDTNTSFPPGFFEGADIATVQNTSSANTMLMVQLASASTKTNYTTVPCPHDGSPTSVVAAIRCAVSKRVDVIEVDVPCSQIQQNVLIGDAIVQARLGGTVVLCKEAPSLVPVMGVVPGGAPVIVSKNLTNTGGRPGTVYSSSVKRATPDIEVRVVPGKLLFETAGEDKKKVQVTVFALGTNSGGGTQRPRWREAHVVWTDGTSGGIVKEWDVVIRIS